MMLRALSLLFLVLSSVCLLGQDKKAAVTLSGYIQDDANGEALIGAAVYLKEANTGGVTNVYGFYSITIQPGDYSLQVSYLGFQSYSQALSLTKNTTLNVALTPKSQQLEEVVVEGELKKSDVSNTEMGTNTLSTNTITQLPRFFGEPDVLKSILTLPGVSTVGEGASGFNVRGGSVGQNLTIFDDAPVYNASHLIGFFSVFNPDAVKNVKLYKGFVPARYGGRLSSILDVRAKEGNNKKVTAAASLGVIFSKAVVEVPLVKDKASFIVAGRASYVDLLARIVNRDYRESGLVLNFYDIIAKFNYSFSDRDKLYLSGYYGRDAFKLGGNQGFGWGNVTTTLRWNHLYSSRLFSNITALYSRYDYELQFGQTDRDKFTWNSLVENFILKPSFTFFINDKNELDFGAEFTYYIFNPANAVGVSNGQTNDISLEKKYSLESNIYAGNRMKITNFLSLEYGLRFSYFNSFGPGTQYEYANAAVLGERRPVSSSRQYKEGELMSSYFNFEPRVSFSLGIGKSNSIKGSYGRMAQYIHLISNTTASNPLDVWVPTSASIKPETGDQFSLGYFIDFGPKQKYEASLEIYYRQTQNQIDYIDGADILINPFLEGDLLIGKGRAYGIEMYLHKKTGRFNGWISYALARTELQVAGINKGTWYPTRYDQTHNLSVVGFFDINDRWSVTGTFTYKTGTPATFPTSRYSIQGILVPHNVNASRNNFRIDDYHRLDLGVTYQGKKFKKDGTRKKILQNWNLSLYNVYSRQNPFSVSFSQNKDTNATQATQLSILGVIVPSFSWTLKFVNP